MGRRKSSTPRITSLEELRLHRQQLEMEVSRTETAIGTGFREIGETLSPLNLIRYVGQHFASLKIFTSAFILGKALLAWNRRKKNRKKNQKQATNEAGS